MNTQLLCGAITCATSVMTTSVAFGGDTFTVVVNTTQDTMDNNPGDGLCFDNNGNCSIRAAIQEANALGVPVRIILQPGTTYPLTQGGQGAAGENNSVVGDLDIYGVVRIQGNGATIAPSVADRAFDIMPGGSLTAINLNVTGGSVTDESGGGFRSAGLLNLRSCAITDCEALGAGASGGAIFNSGGELIVINSMLSGNHASRAGGAIEANAGSTTIDRTTMMGNFAGDAPGNGGAFHLTGAGDVDVRFSRVMNNVAAREGGGLWNSAVGEMTVHRTVITGNAANGAASDDGGGGVFNDGGVMTITDSRIEGNQAVVAAGSGGGVFNNAGDLTIMNTRIESNVSARAGGEVEALGGSTTINDSRLAGNAAGPAPGNGGGLHLTGTGTVDIASTEVFDNQASAEGGGLWNSGGGVMTVVDSTINGNTASGDSADQGGGGLFNAGGELMVSNSTIMMNVADGAAGSGGGVLNDQGVLTIESSMIGGNTSNRAGGAVEANAGVTTIVGSDLNHNATGPAPGNGGAFHLTGPGVVNIMSINAMGNTAAAEGGGFWNSIAGEMTIANAVVSGNTASGEDADQGGGGLFNDGGVMHVTNSTVTGNVADGASGSGGGALNNLGVLTVTGTEISGNTSNRAGGAVEANGGTTTITASWMNDNLTGAAPGNGGAFHLSGTGEVEAPDTVVTGNVAAAEGGGLWNSAGGVMVIADCLIADNTASGAAPYQGGGGVFNEGGVMVIAGGMIENNVADGASGSGGGVLNNNGQLLISETELRGNTSNRAGGAVEANVGVTVLENVDMILNSTGPTPGNGGGLHLTGAGDVVISGGLVLFNDASNEGGGLWNSTTGTMSVEDAIVIGNFAPIGPNVFNQGGVFTIDGQSVPAGP